MGNLKELSRLFLGFNRMSNSTEIDHLAYLPNLKELDVSSNAFARKQNHRMTTLCKFPQLQVLDGREVTEWEKDKVREILYPEENEEGLVFTQNNQGKIIVTNQKRVYPGLGIAKF
jgi:hypothetical protein